MAINLAELSFTRGMPGESQRRYQQAAELAADDRAAADALRSAAGAAESRHFGNEALELRRAAADAALRAGDRAGAAGDLARNAELINRGPGLMATGSAVGEVEALIAEGWALAGGDLAAEARLLTAEAFNSAIADPATVELGERALTLARRIEDPLIESAALDQLTAVQLARGEVRAAAASALRRTELLAPMPVTAMDAFEFFDGFNMAAACAIAAGDLPGARKLAERLRDLPFHHEDGHLATRLLLVVTTLAGDWDETITLAERYREGWERAGRPRAGNLSRGAYAAATVHGLRGDDDARAGWLDIVDSLVTPGLSLSELHFGEFFDALLLLHRGLPQQAMQVLDTPPEEFKEWYNGLWRAWYAALWAEAAALSRARGRRRPHSSGPPDDYRKPDRYRHRRPRGGLGRAGWTGRRPRRVDRRGRRPAGRRLPLPVGPDSRVHRRGAPSTWRVGAGDDGCHAYGLASRMMLNGVSVARRTWLNPASRSTMASWRSPAWAPSPRPTSCASDPGVQITVDRP